MAKKPPLSDKVRSAYAQMGLIAGLSSQKFFIDTSISVEELEESILNFEIEKNKLIIEMDKSLEILRAQPMLAAFVIWSKDSAFGKEFPDYPKKLVDQKIINFTKSSKQLLIISDLNTYLLEEAIESIRIQNKEIYEKEILVLSYLNFMNWVRTTTHLTSLEIHDPDKKKTERRWLSYDAFIKFLTKLDNRCQLVAKLLFFGGSRTLAEVLNLEIQHINFKKRLVVYDKITISYPGHVLEDLRHLIDGRKAGRVFLGRNGSSLNAATIFRNFKDSALEVGLDDDFSPKMLTVDV